MLNFNLSKKKLQFWSYFIGNKWHLAAEIRQLNTHPLIGKVKFFIEKIGLDKIVLRKCKQKLIVSLDKDSTKSLLDSAESEF